MRLLKRRPADDVPPPWLAVDVQNDICQGRSPAVAQSLRLTRYLTVREMRADRAELIALNSGRQLAPLSASTIGESQHK